MYVKIIVQVIYDGKKEVTTIYRVKTIIITTVTQELILKVRGLM